MTGKGSDVAAVAPGNSHPQQQMLNDSDIDSFDEEDSSSQSEGVVAPGGDQDDKAFYMENFSERQLQQAVSLFSAEFKPVSGL